MGLFPLGVSRKDGVHDLAGNVLEWTSDVWSEEDATGEDPPRAVRGGSWYGYAEECRAAFGEDALHPTSRYDILGFRVLCCHIPGHLAGASRSGRIADR